MVRRRDGDEETRKFGERAAASDDASSRKERMRPPSFSQVLSHSWSRNDACVHEASHVVTAGSSLRNPLLHHHCDHPLPSLSLSHSERATTPFYAKGEFPLCHAAPAARPPPQVETVGIYPSPLCDENMSSRKR